MFRTVRSRLILIGALAGGLTLAPLAAHATIPEQVCDLTAEAPLELKLPTC